jgi:hypothetical protein
MVKEAKSPIKNLVRQRCAEEFNFGVKGLTLEYTELVQKCTQALSFLRLSVAQNNSLTGVSVCSVKST